MTLYRNKNFTARNFECANLVAAEAPEGVAPRGTYWEPAAVSLAGLDHLYTENGVRYFGHA